jgi:hypothetical protein
MVFPGLDGLARSLNFELEFHWERNPKTLKVAPAFKRDGVVSHARIAYRRAD